MEYSIGEKKILEIFKVKNSYPHIFEVLLSKLYKNRKPISVNEISEALNLKYSDTHNVVIKLINIGVLSKSKNSKNVSLSQEGIDFYKKYSTLNLDLDNGVVKSICRKHALTALKLLNNGNCSWSDLQKEMGIGESSLKNILDSLVDAGLVNKNRNYSIENKGKEVLDAIDQLSETKFTSMFEIQMKIFVSEKYADKIKKNIESIEGEVEDILQEDTYFKSHVMFDNESYLRLRLEKTLNKQSLRLVPKYNLTWTNIIYKKEYDNNLWIIGRQKEEIEVKYPAILFFLEHLGAEEHHKIVKKRRKVTISDKPITINIDKIKKPQLMKYRFGIFVELKSNAWSKSEALDKAKLIQEIAKDIGLRDLESIKMTYYKLVQEPQEPYKMQLKSVV